MRRTLKSPRATRSLPDRPAGGRDIGPIGTASRVVGGLVAIALPIALSGISGWDVGGALVVFPIVATGVAAVVTVGYERFSRESLMRPHSICSGPACLLSLTIAAVAVALGALTPISEVALFVWLGTSMLLAAARGDGGCEVLALPNAITGRRDRIGCILYTPIDAAEARHRTRRTKRSDASMAAAAGSGSGA